MPTRRETLRRLARHAQWDRVTLVYAASDRQHNNAVVLRQYLALLKVEDAAG